MLKRICIVTGSRADYGVYYPIIQKIKASGKLKLQMVVTCMHLMKEFGYTVNEIRKDGFHIDSMLDISYSKDSHAAMADSMGKLVSKISSTFNKLKPDMALLLGDRGEMLAAAFAANYLHIPVGHIHGGEVSGHIDGVFRHAITKLSHIHFASTRKSAERIIKLGEDPKKVFIVGAPALDRILSGDYTDKSKLAVKYGLDLKHPVLMLAQHPVSSEFRNSAQQITGTLKALSALKHQTVIIYPNADAGGRKMIKVIKQYSAKYRFLNAYQSIPHKDYLGLLRISSVLIGNSSSGIVEAPSFRLPVVNIGTRQEGREQGFNVINSEYGRASVLSAAQKALSKNVSLKNPYGDGKASTRIIRIIEKLKFNDNLRNKRLTY